MPLLKPPVHPFHLTIGEGLAQELQLLIAHTRKLFGDAHHGTVEFTDHPAIAIGTALRHVTLAAPQLHQLFEALLEGAAAELAAVDVSFLTSLLGEQSLNGARGQVARHRLEQAQGEIFTAVRELALALGGELPAVAGASWALAAAARLDQALLLETAEVASHRLHGNLQMIGQFGGGGHATAEEHGEGCFASGGVLAPR